MMELRLRLALAAAVLVLFSVYAVADTYVVQPDGLGDYATIQAAVMAVTDGDVIELTDGTFTGEGNRDIMVPSRGITIRSQSEDPMACVIDCEGSARAEHRGFYFDATIGSGDATLDGVGIINGYTTENGGGILIEGTDAVIDNCIIGQCTAAGSLKRGGGIYVSSNASPRFVDCIITGCSAPYGGGISVYVAGGLFESCTIIDNTATTLGGGVYMQSATESQFIGCSIVGNEAMRVGGVRAHSTVPGDISIDSCDISRNTATYDYAGGLNLLSGTTVTNCTIVENSALFGAGGGVYCSGSGCALTRCIIAYSEDGCGVAASAEGNEPTITCCDVYDNADGDYDTIVGDQTGVDNNISEIPEFCGMEAGDYRLFDTSPCLDTESPCGLLVGAFGQGCDSPVEEMSWGAIKVLYR